MCVPRVGRSSCTWAWATTPTKYYYVYDVRST